MSNPLFLKEGLEKLAMQLNLDFNSLFVVSCSLFADNEQLTTDNEQLKVKHL